MGDYCRRQAEEAALKKWGDLPCFDDWDRRKMRPMPIGAAPKPPTARKRDLTEALERTRAALRLLQPALNVMARECLDDIIAREIDAPLAAPAQEVDETERLREAVQEGIDQLHWINAQAENAMATSAGAASANGDNDGALQMLNSIASDIGINAMMLCDKLSAALLPQDKGEASRG